MEDNTEDLTTAYMLGKYDGRKESQAANSRCSDSAGSSPEYIEHLERIVADLDSGEYPECGQVSQTIKKPHRKHYPQNY